MADDDGGLARVGALGRRAAGFAVAALALLPAFLLLDPAVTGSAGAYVRGSAANVAALMWSGTLLALIPFVLALRLGADLPLARWLDAAGARLVAVPARRFAFALALLSTALAAAFGLLVLEGRPNLVDAMAQLAHARLFAEGALAGPTEHAVFHVFPNTVVTDAGWVSQYPPGHAALLALGLALDAAWLVGPLLLGVTLWFTALIADRLLPHARVAVRVVLVLLAASPFLIAHAGSYMNHTSAAALTVATIWCALRALDGGAGYAIAAGVLGSAALTTRPLAALVMIGAAVLGIWLGDARRTGAWHTAWRRFGLAFAGALPITLLHLWYNAHFFGGPFRLGYVVAYGPSHELGFGVDPWGNRYGALEALAYTSSDLTLLGVALFETPLPLIALAGLYLLLARRIEPGAGVIAAWAIAPVAANFFYWHHGVFMGPRMLNEAAPAWALLVALGLAALVRAMPHERTLAGRRYAPRVALTVALLAVAAASLVFMTPRRLLSYGGGYLESRRVAAPAPRAPALVFVHGPWMSRVGSRLIATGMRLDSLETAVRQNATCALEHYADARERGVPYAGPPIDFEPRADSLPPTLEISAGNYIRVAPEQPIDEACLAEARADRRGVIELALLSWQGNSPASHDGVLFVRDMGPARNRVLLDAMPERTPYLFASRTDDHLPELMAYDEGMRLVWEGAP